MDSKLENAVVKGREGDRQSLTQIYYETKDMVYFTILKLIRNEDDARDLVQDTYIKVFENLGKLRNQKSFIKWLKAIAVNVSKNYLKKCRPLLFRSDEEEQQELANIPEISEDFLPEEYADRKEKCRLIMDIVDNLPDLQRIAVLLYYFGEMSIGEVAIIMETNEGTVKSRLNYARKQIKEEVEEQEKKGTKLYGIQTVPILAAILRNVSKEYQIPAGASANILEASLKAGTGKASAGAGAGSGANAGKVAAGGVARQAMFAAGSAGSGTAGIAAKFMASSLAVKIIASIAAVAVVVGGGFAIGQAVSKGRRSIEQGSIATLPENREWEELLGKTREQVITILGHPDKEDADELYYNGGSVPSYLKVVLAQDNMVVMVSCDSSGYSVYGIKKGDTLDKVKSTFGGIADACLDGEDVDCGSLTAVFYTIDDFSYQFLYDEKGIVDHFAVSLIRHETSVQQEPAPEESVQPSEEEPAEIDEEEVSQGDGYQAQQNDGETEGNIPAEQAPADGDSPQAETQAPDASNKIPRIAVEDLIFADKASIIERLGKPISDDIQGNSETMLFDGVMVYRDYQNKDLGTTTQQQNYMMTLSSGNYSAYGFYPGMSKEEFLRNAQKYGLRDDEYGTYSFYFPGGGTTVELYVNFSLGGNNVFEVTLQAFVAW